VVEMNKEAGRYFLIFGLVLAVVLGLVPSASLGGAKDWIYTLMVLISFVIGFWSIPDKHSKDFVHAAAILAIIYIGVDSLIVSWAGLKIVGPYIYGVFQTIVAFIAPAAVAVVFRMIWGIARSPQ
jgi:hypothetical protein